MPNYDTVSTALNSLKERGYTKDFNIAFDNMICKETNECLNPNEFEITEVYRLEGEPNHSDEAIGYAIVSNARSMKRSAVNAYGLEAGAMCD